MGVALGPSVSVTVGVKLGGTGVMVNVGDGVWLGGAVSVGVDDGTTVSVGVEVDTIVGIAVVGVAEGAACVVARPGKLQARIVKPSTRNKNMDFLISSFYKLFRDLPPLNIL